MRRILKTLHLIASKIINTLISILSVILFSSFLCNKEIKKCISKKKFDECIILGNGPSLTHLIEEHIDDIQMKEIFAVNFFCNTKFFEITKPSYYVLLDPDCFTRSVGEDIERQINELIENFNLITWKMVLFIPNKFKKSSLLERFKSNNLSIVIFNSTQIQGLALVENYLFKINLGMPTPESVINAVIFLAINMEFKTIHLHGVEQSWLKYLTVNNNNKISVGLPHFYSGADKTDDPSSLSEFLLSQVRLFRSHMRLQKYAKHNNQLILNHTPDSYIDAYERKI